MSSSKYAAALPPAALLAMASAWLLLSTIILPRYPGAAVSSDVIVSLMLMVVAVLLALLPGVPGPGWAGNVLGLWVLLSPWILGHSDSIVALRNEVATATVVLIATSWSILTNVGIRYRERQAS